MNLTNKQILGLMLVICGALAGGGAQLTDIVGPNVTKGIVAFAGLMTTILGGVVTMISGQGSQIKDVLNMPGVEKLSVNSNAGQTLAVMAVNPDMDKIAPTPLALDAVTATAKGNS